MPRSTSRTATCGRAEAATRLVHAEKFQEVAELAADESGTWQEYANVSASMAVLAGVAASDAACCATLGRLSRGQDHKSAVDLLRQVEPGGGEVARHLDRLLDLKDAANYGVINVAGADLRAALRQSAALLAFARRIIRE